MKEDMWDEHGAPQMLRGVLTDDAIHSHGATHFSVDRRRFYFVDTDGKQWELDEDERKLVPLRYHLFDLQPLPGVSPISTQYNAYQIDVSDVDIIDVYEIHNRYKIDDSSGAIQHASKKLLLAGTRTGNKPKYKDIKEARDTLNRWLEMNNE